MIEVLVQAAVHRPPCWPDCNRTKSGTGTVSYNPPPQGFRTFLIVWLTQSISVVGSTLTYFAIIVWLSQSLYPGPTQQKDLALAIMLVTLAFSIPTVFAAPLAGAYADRHDRKRIMLVTDVLSGLLRLVLAAYLLTGGRSLWPLLAILAAASIIGATHASAFDASYVMLVTKQQLPRANGMMQTTWALGGILAPAIAAAIIALPGLARQGAISGSLGAFLGRLTDGVPLAIAADAVTFLLASASLLFLSIPSPKRADLVTAGAAGAGAAGATAGVAGTAAKPKRKTLWSDIMQGFHFIRDRRPLLSLLLVFAVVNLTLAPLGVLMPLLVKFRLAADWTARGFSFETALALISSLFALGGVVGGVFISLWGGLRKRRVWGVLVPIIPGAIAIAVFGLSTSLYLAAAMAFVCSLTPPIANAHSQAIWQTPTSPELQGRVFSVRRLIAQFTNPIGTAVAGSLAGFVGAATVLAVSGAAQAVSCTSQLFNRKLLRVEDKEYLEALAAKGRAARNRGGSGKDSLSPTETALSPVPGGPVAEEGVSARD